MSTKALPAAWLSATTELFKYRRASLAIAPKQNGRIAWLRLPGQHAIEYFWSTKENLWMLVKPNPRLEQYAPRVLRVTPTSTSPAIIPGITYISEGRVELTEQELGGAVCVG